MEKFSYKVVQEFIKDYYMSNQILRLGQAFMNKFWITELDEVDNLWNVEDDKNAEQIILNNYVDYDLK